MRAPDPAPTPAPTAAPRAAPLPPPASAPMTPPRRAPPPAPAAAPVWVLVAHAAVTKATMTMPAASLRVPFMTVSFAKLGRGADCPPRPPARQRPPAQHGAVRRGRRAA